MTGRSYSYSPPGQGYGRNERSPSPRGGYGGYGRRERSPSPRGGYGGYGRRERSPSPRGGYGGYGRRERSPSPRGGYGGRGRGGPKSLLVRNLRLDCRPDDLRREFGEFGQLKDVYLPRDYYTGEPRGFGFVQFVDAADADEAQYQMDGQIFDGRRLTVVFAEENRKKPDEMRRRDRTRSRSYDHRKSSRYSRSPRHSRPRSRGYSRSRTPSPSYHSSSGRHRQYSRSLSPRDRKVRRERSYDQSPVDSRSRSGSPANGYYGKPSTRERTVSESE